YHGISFVINDLIKLLGWQTQKVPYFVRKRFEVPDMCYRNNKLNMAHPFPPYFLFGNFHPTSVTDDPFISNAFVFPTMTFPILYRPENPLTEQASHFGFIGSVIDCFRLRYLTMRAIQNGFWRSQTNSDPGKVVV